MKIKEDKNANFILFLFQAKQRASVKWLLSKAYNNQVPDKLREPYYRDHEVRTIKKNFLIPNFHFII